MQQTSKRPNILLPLFRSGVAILRYGENPQCLLGDPTAWLGLAQAEHCIGKDMSYNNFTDGRSLAGAFTRTNVRGDITRQPRQHRISLVADVYSAHECDP